MGNTILISVITSATITSGLLFIFKTIFKSKITHYFQTELEKYKSNLEMVVDSEKKIANRRFEIYPHTAELTYRTRNRARDLSIQFSPTEKSLYSEFKTMVHDFEENLFINVNDFRQDCLFAEIHEYKRLLFDFLSILSSIEVYIEQQKEEHIIHNKNSLIELYNKIDEKHLSIVDKLNLKNYQKLK